MSYPYRSYNRLVRINSDQTTKQSGEIVRTEYDRYWGPQFYIAVPDDEQGKEYFWMREYEIKIV